MAVGWGMYDPGGGDRLGFVEGRLEACILDLNPTPVSNGIQKNGIKF